MRGSLVLLFVALVFFAPAPTTGAPVPKSSLEDKIKLDLARLEGKWRVVSYQKDGVERSLENVAQMAELTFSGREFSWGGPPAGSIAEIDPTATPKTISYKYGDDQAPSDFGIYMIEGDIFVDCFSRSEKDRPKSFTSKPGSGHTLVVYKRIRTEQK